MKLTSRRTREEQDCNCLHVIQKTTAAVVDSMFDEVS